MPKTIHRPEYEILRRMIRGAREDAGEAQATLTEQLGRSQSFLSDIERGVRRIDVIELRDLCRILKLDFLTFMGRFEAELSRLPSASRRGKAR